MTLDVTKPSNSDSVDSIAETIRETRTAIEASEVVTVADIELTLVDPIPILEDGINIITISSQNAIQVASFGIVADGSLVIVRFSDGNITLMHEVGNLNLMGDPNAPDFPVEAGDMIILLYQDSKWNELLRTLA